MRTVRVQNKKGGPLRPPSVTARKIIVGSDIGFSPGGRKGGARKGGGGVWTVDKTTVNQYTMQDEDFEWEDAKAARNQRDHAISFAMARESARFGGTRRAKEVPQ